MKIAYSIGTVSLFIQVNNTEKTLINKLLESIAEKVF